MNRQQRRLQERATRRDAPGERPAVSSRPTTGLRFKCGGVHDGGCPDRASIILAIGTRAARDGLALDTLHAALKGAGWALGAGRTDTASGPVAWVEPLCPACSRALASEITVDGKAPMAPEVRYSLEREGLLPHDPSAPHAYEEAGSSPAAGSIAEAIGAWPCRLCGEAEGAAVHAPPGPVGERMSPAEEDG